MLQVRKSSRAFGRGTLRFIRPGNRKVIVYLREHGEDTILCVANLARSAAKRVAAAARPCPTAKC